MENDVKVGGSAVCCGSLRRLVTLAFLLCPVAAWGWGSDGHKIVAIVAADNLTAAAQSHVANILGVPANQIGTAMELASVRPDSEFREEDRSTAPWHFIDICLQDGRIDVPARCPGGNCVTGKIDEYSRRKCCNFENGAEDAAGGTGRRGLRPPDRTAGR